MALQTKTISDTASKGHHKFALKVVENSTSTSDNTSSVTFTFTLDDVVAGYNWSYSSTVPVTWKVIIAGKTYTGNIMSYGGSGVKTLKTATISVPHNTDGTKSISYSFSVSSISASYLPGSSSNSGSMTLTKIPRKATITSAPNFTDEGNPTIGYSNKAGSSVDALEACIANSSGTILIGYRSISKTGSSYTFNFTDAERTTLRKHIATGNSATVRFYVRTTIGDTKYTSYLSKTLSLVNYTPTLNPTVKDTGSTSTALTGDPNIIIKGFNIISVSSGGAARKNATIKSQKVTCGSKSISSGSGTLGYVESGTFNFSITDSRGYTTTKPVTKTLIPYIKPTCSLKVKIGVDGVADITASGNFFNGSFGAVTNTLTVQYRYKEANGTYTSWNTMSLNPNGNTYTATKELTGLDYSKTYVFQAKATDKINEFAVTTPEKKVKSRPIFDWNEDNFHVHGDLKVEQNNLYYSLLGAAKALSTAYTMTCTPTAGSGWSNASASAYLLGNCLRVYVAATRNEAPLMGNQTNETVMTFKLEHGGKIDEIYRVGFCNDTEGSVGSYSAQAAKNSDGTFTITILQTATTPYSSAATTASKSMNGYFIMPANIQLAAYV